MFLVHQINRLPVLKRGDGKTFRYRVGFNPQRGFFDAAVSCSRARWRS